MRRILIVVIILIIIAVLTHLILENKYTSYSKTSFGVTFSSEYAEYLSTDWKKTFLAILDELQVKNWRLTAYWEDLEKEAGSFDFSIIDFMLDQIKLTNSRAILVLGAKQPRWPECHLPLWVKPLDLTTRREKILEFINKVVERYKEHQEIIAWQLENEPFLKSFGEECFSDESFLKREVQTVKAISNKPIILTDSGELGNWIVPMKLADIFGTTLYRDVYDKFFGQTTYPLPSYFYNIKANLVKALLKQKDKKIIVIEFQAEPWVKDYGLADESIENQIRLFPLKKFKANIDYAKKVGFSETYLWGVEWWYFMKEHGHPEYLEFAKTLFIDKPQQ